VPNLSIKDVPEALADALRRRAAMNHRSLQGELMFIIEQAAAGMADAPCAASRGTPSARQGHKTIEQIAAEMRATGVRPVAGQPLAVDILRADRDAR
jgi:plasmid stability protein